MRKCIVLILDGLGDLPVAALGGKTPLEAAETPNFDRLAVMGQYGLVDPVAPGVIPNTHSGVGLMLGLRPEQLELLKRGPIEASGAGMTLRPGEIAFRANLATLEEREGRFYVVDRRAGRVTADSAGFATVLDEFDLGDGVSARFRPTDQHRGSLVLDGPGLGAALSDTDPGDRQAPGWLNPCKSLEPGSEFAAKKVNHFIAEAHERLKSHPLNQERIQSGKLPVTGIITRGAGAWFRLEHLLEEHGINSALVAGCNTVIGLAKKFGMETVREAGFTAGVDTDIRAKLAAARAALSRHQLVYVHIKAPDLCSHDFRPESKKWVIERIDRAVELLEGSGAAIALTADHTTDSNTGAHSHEPVPALFCGPLSGSDGSATPVKFGESACRNGTMPRRRGHEFLADIVTYLES